MGEPRLPRDVLAYYEARVEVERLATGAGVLELERTKELVSRRLPPSGDVADVGGGTGLYAEWLAARGYRVELVEPVPLHVELARERAGEPPRFGVRLGEARALPLSDESFDAVLLLGPLYHLGERDDRLAALREAARVLRAGGVVIAAAICRFAPLLDAIARGRVGDAQLFGNVQAETETGRRVPEERRTAPFPDAYFHLPGELREELAAAGLEVEGVFGVQGPGWLLPDFETHWRDPETRERILWAARQAEADEHLLALSAHLLGIATKR